MGLSILQTFLTQIQNIEFLNSKMYQIRWTRDGTVTELEVLMSRNDSLLVR